MDTAPAGRRLAMANVGLILVAVVLFWAVTDSGRLSGKGWAVVRSPFMLAYFAYFAYEAWRAARDLGRRGARDQEGTAPRG